MNSGMKTKRYTHRVMLSTLDVIYRLSEAVQHRTPFALVRIGDGENIVLAQEDIIPIKDIIRTRWGRLSRETNRKGIHLPNLRLRDELVAAIRHSDIVGIPYYNDKELRAPQKYLRTLTDKCYAHYNLSPKHTCHTLVNRHMVETEKFWELLRGRRVALISRWANPFADILRKQYKELNINVVKAIPFSNYSDYARSMKEMEPVECDIVLISAGVNAVLLASQLKEQQGRVAVDFGKTAMFMVKGESERIHPWILQNP